MLFPSFLRDLLMRLAVTDLFRGKWTAQIHEEWIDAVLKRYAHRTDITRQHLQRTRQLMDENVLDALVTDYAYLIPVLNLPDPDDRHVLAAAIKAHASVIVTFNLKDFPARLLSVHQIEAQHPDDFIAQLYDLDAAAVCASARRHRLSLKNLP